MAKSKTKSPRKAVLPASKKLDFPAGFPEYLHQQIDVLIAAMKDADYWRPILLFGPPGSGRGEIAKYLHYRLCADRSAKTISCDSNPGSDWLAGQDTVLLDGVHLLDYRQQESLIHALDQAESRTGRKLMIASSAEVPPKPVPSDAFRRSLYVHKPALPSSIRPELLQRFLRPLYTPGLAGLPDQILQLAKQILVNLKWDGWVAPLVPLALRANGWDNANRRELIACITSAVESAPERHPRILTLDDFMSIHPKLSYATFPVVLLIDTIWEVTPERERGQLPIAPRHPTPPEVLARIDALSPQDRALLQSLSADEKRALGVTHTLPRGEHLKEQRFYSVQEVGAVEYWTAIHELFARVAGAQAEADQLQRAKRISVDAGIELKLRLSSEAISEFLRVPAHGFEEAVLSELTPPVPSFACAEPWREFWTEKRIYYTNDFKRVYYPDRVTCFVNDGPTHGVVKHLIIAKRDGDGWCPTSAFQIDLGRHPGQLFRGKETGAIRFRDELILSERGRWRLKYPVELYSS